MPGRLHLSSVRRCEKGGSSILVLGPDWRWRARPFLCHTWRCRRCGPWVDRQLLERIRAAVEPWPFALFLTLTIDPKLCPSAWDSYHLAGELWERRLLRRIVREFGAIQYVATVERHVSRSKHAHLNVLMRGPGLEAAARAAGSEMRFDKRAAHGRGRWCRFSFLRPWFAKAAPACKFGIRVWLEEVRGTGGIARYMARAAADLASARFKVDDQTPLGAPPHLRRLRTSKHLMPEIEKSGEDISALVVHEALEDVPLVPDAETGELVVPVEFVDGWAESMRKRRQAVAGRKRRVVYER